MEKQESFTSSVKHEIASNSFDGVKLRALLSAFCRINGKLSIVNGESKIILQTENAKVAKFMFVSFQNRYNISPRFAYLKNMHFKKNTIYNVILEQKVDDIIDDLEILDYESKVVSFVRSEDSLCGFLIGSFLATGSVNNPQSSNYHLEISTSDENLANYILNIMQRVRTTEFTPKIIKRRNHYVVYLKKSEQIANLLIYLSASQTCLEYEDYRINRDFINNDNRLQICTDANVKRTVDSAQKQIEDIKFINSKTGIKNIGNPKATELALLRLENEEASMADLAEMLQEKLDKPVSKSSVNHLFRYIKERADKLRQGGKNE